MERFSNKRICDAILFRNAIRFLNILSFTPRQAQIQKKEEKRKKRHKRIKGNVKARVACS